MQSSNASSLSPIASSPLVGNAVSPVGPRHHRAGSEPYYEDVDPRFAVEEPSDDGYMSSHHNSGVPNALTPGGGMTPGALAQQIPGNYPATPGASQPVMQPQQQHYGQYRTQPSAPNPAYLHPTYAGTAGGANGPDSDPNLNPIDPNIIAVSNPNSTSSQENLPDGARSPNGGGSERASETSHFTSISDRPVNPNWRPASISGSRAGSAYGGGPQPSQQRRRDDVILAANPDFRIPGMGPARGAGRPGARGGSPGMGMASSRGGGGVVPGGRYPTDI